MWWIRKIGSLSFTVFICLFLMVLLIVSTTFESRMGTEAAQQVFYQRLWFDAALGMLWLNVFCAMVTRFPFKKRHFGFLLTHVGILGLLAGALLTRIGGVEGKMLIFEGETQANFVRGDYELDIRYPDQTQVEWKDISSGTVIDSRDGREISIMQVIKHAVEEAVINEDPAAEKLNHAVEVGFKSALMEADETFWLIEHSGDPQANRMRKGPFLIFLEKGVTRDDTARQPTLYLKDSKGEVLASLKAGGSLPDVFKIPGRDLVLEGIKYYSHAAVVENKLVNNPEDVPLNPAIEFEAVGPEGEREKIIRFAFFPEFGSMHKKEGKTVMELTDVTVDFQAPGLKPEEHAGQYILTFFYWPDQRWTYTAVSKDGLRHEGSVNIGQAIELSGVPAVFYVNRLLQKASVSSQVVDSGNSKRGRFAVELQIHDAEETHLQWLVESQRVGFRTDKGIYSFMLRRDELPLPFSLTLDDFRKIDYPGTRNPSSYESDVTVQAVEENAPLTRTIRMNKPLDYMGYRIFQGSYFMDPARGEASVFLISRDPGVKTIYASSLIIFIGVFYQFFLNKKGKKHECAKQS